MDHLPRGPRAPPTRRHRPGRRPPAHGGRGRQAAAAVIVYNGEVYNYRELRTELRSYGASFDTASDTEVVLRAYMQWGADCVLRLDGMFAFAVWDLPREELLLARDRLGIKPLYYCPTPHGFLFASEPKAILAHPDMEPVLTADGLREAIGLIKTPGHASFAGLAEVRPGHVVRVGRDGERDRRYWSLEAWEHTDDLATTVGRVRGLVEEAVADQLVTDVPLGAMLSGASTRV